MSIIDVANVRRSDVCSCNPAFFEPTRCVVERSSSHKPDPKSGLREVNTNEVHTTEILSRKPTPSSRFLVLLLLPFTSTFVAMYLRAPFSLGWDELTHTRLQTLALSQTREFYSLIYRHDIDTD
eukprot:9064067-Pyramimonas_sp.AAC.2